MISMADNSRMINYEILVQHSGMESNLDEIYQKVKQSYVDSGHDLRSINDIRLYLKPEDFTAYFVVNGDYSGKVGLF
jgi:hypothetical protein